MPNRMWALKKTKEKMPFLSLPQFLTWEMRPSQWGAGTLALQNGGGGGGALTVVFAVSLV